MTPTAVTLGGELVMLDPLGLLVWPAAGLMAVADLHLEKASAGAPGGALLPPWDSAITLERLAAACALWSPSVLVAVGDSFHDAMGASRLAVGDRARLQRIAAGRRLIWVAGNHDPLPMAGLPGEPTSMFAAGPFRFRHEAGRKRAAHGEVEICGHHHPKARVATRGGSVSRPCFVACAKGTRLMLPAFGAFTGGLEVSHRAIAALFPSGGRVYLTGAARLFGFNLALPVLAEDDLLPR